MGWWPTFESQSPRIGAVIRISGRPSGWTKSSSPSQSPRIGAVIRIGHAPQAMGARQRAVSIPSNRGSYSNEIKYAQKVAHDTLVSIPSNRGSYSNSHAIIYMDHDPKKVSIPSNRGSYSNHDEVNEAWDVYQIVSIPSNRGSYSNVACVLVARKLPSLNPLESGQLFEFQGCNPQTSEEVSIPSNRGSYSNLVENIRSEERRVGKELRSWWSPYQ